MKEDAFILFHLDAGGVVARANGIGPGNSIARDVRLAELPTAKRAAPDPAQLADPAVNSNHCSRVEDGIDKTGFKKFIAKLSKA